jgi:hypothetical protein
LSDKDKEEKERLAERNRVLLNVEEWKDPKTVKVLGEFHKEGLAEETAEAIGVEADLERFDKYWEDGGGSNLGGEYHKEGRPHLERKGDSEIYRKTLSESPKTIPAERDLTSGPAVRRTIDLGTLEIISYALFRLIFGAGVRIPLHRKGVVDMDVVIKDKEVLLNTNQFYAAVPELSVWRITYSHKGKTVLEVGRGVPKGMKIHKFNAFMLVIELWKGSIEAQKAKKAALAQKEKT